jgi:hypothetical protein
VNTTSVNTAAGVILAALTQNRTAAGIALALDSAQMLMTPETVAELKQLTDRVAELESELEALRAQGAVLRGDGITRRIAPTQALRESWEDPHDSPLHHEYRVSHDLPLPETGGA